MFMCLKVYCILSTLTWDEQLYCVQSTAKSTFSGGGGEASRFDITHKSAREDAKSVGSEGF